MRVARAWWPGITRDIKNHVDECSDCQQYKALNYNNSGLLQPLPVPEELWQTITVDFVTALPMTEAGYDTLLVVVDKLSKMCHLLPTDATLTAQRFAHLFMDGVVKHHGFPEVIVSDRDKLFTSHFWETIAGLCGTQLARSSAFHPQSDGQTERYNRIIEDM